MDSALRGCDVKHAAYPSLDRLSTCPQNFAPCCDTTWHENGYEFLVKICDYFHANTLDQKKKHNTRHSRVKKEVDLFIIYHNMIVTPLIDSGRGDGSVQAQAQVCIYIL